MITEVSLLHGRRTPETPSCLVWSPPSVLRASDVTLSDEAGRRKRMKGG